MFEHGTPKISPVKVGVAIALLAVLAALAVTSRTGPAKATVTPVAAVSQLPTGKLSLKLRGLSPQLKTDFSKLNGALGQLRTDAGIFYFFQHTTSKHFLTGTDASKTYLPIGGTAQNANDLRGLPPSAFVQGKGGLVSGAATLSGGPKSQTLLTTQGIEVDVAINGNGLPAVTIANSTGASIPAVLDQGGTDGGITLQPGSNPLTLSSQSGTDQLHLQTFPVGSFNRVVTVILSISVSAAQGASSFAGQLIDGAI